MKLNRKLVLIISLALSLALATGGTLAYLSDTDADVNVMTVGNVYIKQLEYERVPQAGHEAANDAWESEDESDKYGYTPDQVRVFRQDKPLYPAVFADGVIKWDDRPLKTRASSGHQQSWQKIVSEEDKPAPGSNQLFDDSVKNVIDKFVFVENIGNTNAYVRTWFAFEQGDLSDAEFDALICTNGDATHWSWETVETGVELTGPDGAKNKYVIVCATYLGKTSDPNGILAPGAITYPSLLQLYLHPDATNEHVEKVDGNKSGKYDIIVLSQAIQAEGFANAVVALNEGFGEGHPFNEVLGDEEGEENILDDAYYPVTKDSWDGTYDTTWYNDTDTEFVLTTAEQLAGLGTLVDAGNNFAGKTIKLGIDMDFYCLNDAGDKVSLDPIGDKSAFAGTLDGDGHTIENVYQSGWAFGYEWGKYGSIGLFGELESATVKNLTITGAESLVEGGDVGGITGSATGDCVFENITIEDSVFATYNNGNGGIIGWSGAGTYTFKNIKIAEDVVLAGLWGSFDSSIGGVVGQGEPGATYNFDNVDIACRLDVYNDCTASYDYYNYRMCGMIIGRLQETTNIDGTNYPNTAKYNIICNDVTVTYGDWANYHYCEPTPGLNNGRGMRVEAGYSYDGLPADFDHTQCTTNHNTLIPFDQIFGGAQLGVKGLPSYTGVTVIYNNK